MEVRELTKITMIEVPDEWGEAVKRLKEIMPYIKAASNTDCSVRITLHTNGAYDITIDNYTKTEIGRQWTNFCEYVAEDGGGYTYASLYEKGDK